MSAAIMMKALPIVAAALGKKHGVNVVIREGANTASTNGKTIYLPVLPNTEEALVLARGYIDHESAHIRFTDFSVDLGKGLKHALLNILEDIRIEQLLGRELPGCKINLAALEKAFVDGGMYGELTSQSHPAEILVARIHHGLRVDVLKNICTTDLAKNARELFNEAFPPAMVSDVERLLLEAPVLKDTQHAASLADRILEAIGSEQDEPDNTDTEGSEPNPMPGDASEDSEQSDDEQAGGSEGDGSKPNPQPGDTSDDSQKSEDDQAGGGEGEDDESSSDSSGNAGDAEGEDGNEDGTGTSKGDEGESGTNDDSESGDGQSGSEASDDTDDSDGSESNQSTSDQGGESGGATDTQLANQKKLKDSADQEIIPESDLGDKIAKVLSDLNFTVSSSGNHSGTMPEISKPISGQGINTSEAARETTALRTRLFGLIQASKLKRTPPRRHGNRIDTRSLHKLMTGDTRVFRGSEWRAGVNTGVLILLDQSSSMAGIHKEATKAAMAVALALDAIPGVKLSIAGFGSEINSSQDNWDPVVRPMKLFSQRLDRNGFIPAARGGTPAAEALWWAASELLSLQSVHRRIVITITDGQPENPEAVKELVQKMTQASIENTAIGIKVPISTALFPNNCTISDISELPERVFGMLQNMLVVQ